MDLKYNWQTDIVPRLDTIESVDGGYTPAKRGIITLTDDSKVFVKIATDELTAKWLSKEIKVYQLLNAAGYKYMPLMLSHDTDKSSMALEYLEGSSFDHHWDKDKLEAVLAAQEDLKQYAHLFKDDAAFKSGDVVTLDDKWPHLLKGNNIGAINEKLQKLGGGISITKDQILEWSKLHNNWSLKQDTLIHEDIRADNFGYDPKTKQGKLIDWNWLCLGDASLDTTPLFINMLRAGFDPYKYHPEKYDRPMLAYILSYWLASILDGDEDSSPRERKLRVSQMKNIEECLKLLNR